MKNEINVCSVEEDGKKTFYPHFTGCDLANLKKCCSDSKRNMMFVYFEYNYSKTESAFVSTTGFVLCSIPFSKIKELKKYNKMFFNFSKLDFDLKDSYRLTFNNGYLHFKPILDHELCEEQVIQALSLDITYPGYKQIFDESKKSKAIATIRLQPKLLPLVPNNHGVSLFFSGECELVFVKTKASEHMAYVLMPMRS